MMVVITFICGLMLVSVKPLADAFEAICEGGEGEIQRKGVADLFGLLTLHISIAWLAWGLAAAYQPI